MKKIASILMISLGMASCVPAHAHDGFRHSGGYYRPGYNWVAPAIVGGVIGYELSRPRYYYEPYYVPAPVVIQQPPVYVQQVQPSCTAWVEVQQPDGTITRTRTCSQ
jgi:hypothetical protein